MLLKLPPHSLTHRWWLCLPVPAAPPCCSAAAAEWGRRHAAFSCSGCWLGDHGDHWNDQQRAQRCRTWPHIDHEKDTCHFVRAWAKSVCVCVCVWLCVCVFSQHHMSFHLSHLYKQLFFSVFLSEMLIHVPSPLTHFLIASAAQTSLCLWLHLI